MNHQQDNNTTNSPIQVALLGGTQGVGKQCLLMLLTQGIKVRVLARNPTMLSHLLSDYGGEQLTIVQGDATNERDVELLITSSVSHVISALGVKSIGPTSVVESGVRNAVRAMKKLDKEMRIAIITSVGVLDIKFFWFFDNIVKKFIIHNVYSDLANSEKALVELTKNSKISYSIVRPPQLVDAPMNLDINYGEGTDYPKGTFKVSRQDVAAFLLRSLFNEKLQGNR